MALKRLKTAEMVSLISTWVDEAHPDRQVLLQVPLLAALLPNIDDVYQTLADTYGAGLHPTRLAQIQEEQGELDDLHDDLVRVIYYYLLANIHETRAREEHFALEEVLAMLLPEGLRMVQKSYREQAGHVELIANQLGDDARALLAALPLPGERSLLDVVNEWIEHGMRLGELDRERTGDQDGGRPTLADLMEARNRWIRTIQAVRVNVDLLGLDDPALTRMMTHIERAEADADRRAADRANRADDDDVPAPDDDGDGETPGDGDGPVLPDPDEPIEASPASVEPVSA
ncbi:hypothetical protein [Haliangium sp.]|uniref:hypothetical protein n=1 Tax=Haliangium sp. TaxID=2663208 RepID=UPI003D130B26